MIEDNGLIETTAGHDEMIIAAGEALLEAAGTNPGQIGDAIGAISVMLFELNNLPKATSFATYFAKKYKLTKKSILDQVKVLADRAKLTLKSEKKVFDIDGTEEDESEYKGWYIKDNCYYFHVKDGGPVRGSNFIIEPLFHVYSKTDNKRLIRISNRFGYSQIMDIPSKNFISVEQFQAAVINEGSFVFSAGKREYIKVLESISNEFPRCNELHTLGWQREGFYAFANGIYNGRWQPVDTFGITEHKEKKYFSPAFSSVYNELREDDDEYENDRYFVYNQSPISFGEWSRLMIAVYGDNAIIAVAYAIAATFRELIYEKYKTFPHLFLFGEKQSGKSQLGWSLSNLFFQSMPPFNLNSGTQVGFFRRLSRVKNAIVWVDEYTNDIDPKRFQALKSAFDGVGHEKGKMSQDSRTITTKINGAIMISGQYLPTNDDNSLYTRSMMLFFRKLVYTTEQTANYNTLKAHELAGLSSLVADILSFRPQIDEKYGLVFSEIMDAIKIDLESSKALFDERIVRNYCSILAPVKIIMGSENPLKLNFTYETLYTVCKETIIEMTKQISDSESISTFWKTIEYLLDETKIQNKVDFRIANVNSVLITDTKTEKDITIPFETPTTVLYLRLTKIHPLYMERHRQQTGKNGIELISILHYLKSHRAFIGHAPKVRFESTVSTAYCFYYGPEYININLERHGKDDAITSKVISSTGKPITPTQEIIDISDAPPF